MENELIEIIKVYNDKFDRIKAVIAANKYGNYEMALRKINEIIGE